MKNKESAVAVRFRQLLTGARAWLFTRFGEDKARKLIIGAPIALGIALVLVLLIVFTPVRTIEVSGDVDMFNEGDIGEAADVGEGDLMVLHPSFLIKRSIREKLPLVGDIKIVKTPFGKLKINVQVGEVDFYTKVGDKYYAIDEDLRVLDESTKRSKYSAYGAAYVILPEVREPVIGENLVFYDTVEETDTEGETLYEVKEESFYDFASAFLSTLKENERGFLEQTDGIILDERFDVTLIYGLKYKVKFGSVANLDAKLRVLFGILNEGSVVKMEKAVIDLTDPSRATAREDTSLDFTEFDD